jgi:hypothetical protein
MLLPKPVRERNRKHLAYVGSLPSIVSGRMPCVVHHLTIAQPKARSLKAGDQWTVPLTNDEHLALHAAGNERRWWESQSINPMPIAQELWEQSAHLRMRS